MGAQSELVEVHGRSVAVDRRGDGPAIVLIHGLAGSMATWDVVIEPLAGDHTVIAPDLPGHGRSDAPAGDYSLGAYATGLRDLLDALGHDRATVVGHSLGGGIAMQFAYMFPDRCRSLVLVSSGGLGPEVNLLLRAAALPGSGFVLPLISNGVVIGAGGWLARVARRVRVEPTPELAAIARSYAALANGKERDTFLAALRAVVDHRGQRVSADDRLGLAGELPTLLVWGADDRIIPVDHAHRAHAEIPGSRLEIFEDAGHFPHVADPARFAELIVGFDG